MKKLLILSVALLALAGCKKTPSVHPDWTYGSVMYEVNIRQFSPEGTFAGVEAQLPRLKDLGVELKAVHVSSEFLDEVGPYDFRGGLIGDKACTVLFDNSKLKRAVPGFQATVRFEQGVRRTLDYVLSHPECQPADPAFDAWCDRVIAALDAAKASLR